METKDWHAWINRMPPPPDELHVVGTVFVSNPGVEVELLPRDHQGADSSVLSLDVHSTQRPGIWPQVMSWKQARYDFIVIPGGTHFTQVEIYEGNELTIQIAVQIVH